MYSMNLQSTNISICSFFPLIAVYKRKGVDNHHFWNCSCFTSGNKLHCDTAGKETLKLPFSFYVTKVMISQQLIC